MPIDTSNCVPLCVGMHDLSTAAALSLDAMPVEVVVVFTNAILVATHDIQAAPSAHAAHD